MKDGAQHVRWTEWPPAVDRHFEFLFLFGNARQRGRNRKPPSSDLSRILEGEIRLPGLESRESSQDKKATGEGGWINGEERENIEKVACPNAHHHTTHASRVGLSVSQQVS